MELESIIKNGNGKKERADNLPLYASIVSEGLDSVGDKCQKASEGNISDEMTAEIVKSVVEALRRKRGK